MSIETTMNMWSILSSSMMTELRLNYTSILLTSLLRITAFIFSNLTIHSLRRLYKHWYLWWIDYLLWFDYYLIITWLLKGLNDVFTIISTYYMYIHNLIFKKKFDFIFLKILFWNMLDDIFSEINQRMVRHVPSRLICNNIQ